MNIDKSQNRIRKSLKDGLELGHEIRLDIWNHNRSRHKNRTGGEKMNTKVAKNSTRNKNILEI